VNVQEIVYKSGVKDSGHVERVLKQKELQFLIEDIVCLIFKQHNVNTAGSKLRPPLTQQEDQLSQRGRVTLHVGGNFAIKSSRSFKITPLSRECGSSY